MEELINNSREKADAVSETFYRYLYDSIDWKQRLISISGARGVGKTTIMLQHVRKKYGLSDEALYISLDDIYFAANRLTDLTDEFVKNGGKCLIIDEVHKYKMWSREIKNIYDRYNGLKIIFSGSSLLEIHKGEADLSRRMLSYKMYGMSLREYIGLKYNISIPVFSLEDIISKPNDAVTLIKKKIKTPIKYYKEFLSYGYFPYSVDDKKHYHQRLMATINQVFETDLPAVYGINYNAVTGLKKLLYIISRIVPYKPNVSELARQIGISRETMVKYLYYLHKSEVTLSLASNAFGISAMNKPEKIYLNNTNLIYALNDSSTSNIGSVRETFFYSMLRPLHNVNYSAKGDFIVNEKYIFEVGGKNKTNEQIKGLKQAFVVKDEIEYGGNKIIPLWLFGFLY